jgi:hypothetical protein
MDETWLLHYILESNQLSAKWNERHEPNSKLGKTQRSADKVMASVFWGARGIIIIEEGKTINSEYFIAFK